MGWQLLHLLANNEITSIPGKQKEWVLLLVNDIFTDLQGVSFATLPILINKIPISWRLEYTG